MLELLLSMGTYCCDVSKLRGSLLGLSWTPEGAAGFAAGVLAVFENLNAVDENVSDADGILVRLLEGSTVGDSLRIENHYVCKHAFLDKSAVIEPEVCSGQSRKPVHSFRKGNDFFFADVFAEQAGEVAIGAWMRGRFEEHALRGHRRCI